MRRSPAECVRPGKFCNRHFKGRRNYFEWSAKMVWCWWYARRRVQAPWTTWNSSFLLTMRFWCASLRNESDVFASLQSGHLSASSAMGGIVPAAAVLADVLLQLLVRLGGADDCALVEFRQLPATSVGGCLLADTAALDVDCGSRNILFIAAVVSSCLFSFLLRRSKKRSALSVRDHTPLGELSGARLRVEDNLGLRRRAQHAVAVRAFDEASAGVSTL